MDLRGNGDSEDEECPLMLPFSLKFSVPLSMPFCSEFGCIQAVAEQRRKAKEKKEANREKSLVVQKVRTSVLVEWWFSLCQLSSVN